MLLVDCRRDHIDCRLRHENVGVQETEIPAAARGRRAGQGVEQLRHDRFTTDGQPRDRPRVLTQNRERFDLRPLVHLVDPLKIHQCYVTEPQQRIDRLFLPAHGVRGAGIELSAEQNCHRNSEF